MVVFAGTAAPAKEMQNTTIKERINEDSDEDAIDFQRNAPAQKQIKRKRTYGLLKKNAWQTKSRNW